MDSVGGPRPSKKRARQDSEEYRPEDLDLDLDLVRPSKKLKGGFQPSSKTPKGRGSGDGDPSCPKWPLGECTNGDSCKYLHHPNQDPEMQPQFDFAFSTDLNSQTCQLCATHGLRCDREGRAEKEDPCSWCRYFAGGKAACGPKQRGKSPNDILWKMMRDRWRQGYTIPLATKKAPMADGEIRPDWRSDYTREELLKADSVLELPQDARLHPRAYLEVPAYLRSDHGQIEKGSLSPSRQVGFKTLRVMEPPFEQPSPSHMQPAPIEAQQAPRQQAPRPQAHQLQAAQQQLSQQQLPQPSRQQASLQVSITPLPLHHPPHLSLGMLIGDVVRVDQVHVHHGLVVLDSFKKYIFGCGARLDLADDHAVFQEPDI